MKKTLLLFLFSMLNLSMPAQTVIDGEERDIPDAIPGEQVFIHFNTSLLFSGEYLYYKVYCMTAENPLPSPISKIAYVELVGKDGTTLFKHKIVLDEGTGQGDFFVPTSVPSGNYKILGYTQWMKNAGSSNFFQNTITIINPYRGEQPVTSSPTIAKKESLLGTSPVIPEDKLAAAGDDDHLQLTISGDRFRPRERVSLTLTGKKETGEVGNYSISVRRLDNFDTPSMFTSKSFSNLYGGSRNLNRQGEKRIYLPELRGDLISGFLRSHDQSLSTFNQKIALSIPGENYVFKIATTDETGQFYFNLSEDYSGGQALIQVIGKDKEHYVVEMNKAPSADHSSLEFPSFTITPSLEEQIIERSIYNQVENAYYQVKPDTLHTLEQKKPFYNREPLLYDLDDFTRFPTIRETFIEIIRYARITRNNKGDLVFEVRGHEGSMNYNLPPLLLVDGVMVQQHEDFIAFPAKKVKSIGILRDNFHLGSQIFKGVIDVKTLNGDFNTFPPAYVHDHQLMKPLAEKKYFQQTYDDSTERDLERVPDFRYQLLWVPRLQLKKEETLEFFTSDVTGDFEIRVEGFTGKGEPVSIRKSFKVQ